MRSWLRGLALASFALLAACATRQVVPPPATRPPPVQPQPIPQPVPPPPANAVQAGIALAAPAILSEADAAEALRAFRLSCSSLVRRTDKSGLTNPADWQGVCAQAAAVQPGGASAFFQYSFDWLRVGDGKAFATGYFEPEIAASPVQAPGYTTPIYVSPPDLVRCTLPDGKTGRGRIDENGQCTLYFTRADINRGVLAGKGLELAWAADPVELFFLEIQGSGRLRFPDGTVMRIGYANQNGRDYVAIGRLLKERGILPPGGTNMDSIVAWMRSNPDAAQALMEENLSYIFFKVLTGPGPLGALGIPVTPRATVAADPNFIPLGAPVFLSVDRPEASGIWVAQDTGGAIKGSNRVDTFWGAGEDARRIAGGMSAKGQAFVLIPKGAAARALAQR
ncbi:MltA domain-containing protein [Sphingomonas sp. RG327]|uniref:peptidoglycan lytic exotransglycosylase n=1 Tax=Sphingomonas anseongensis TaxID=2908207 RepID=A0ABT0RCD0_9SPHN|nr:MltA domain-containing protein [Sphingomonas anseongensis]